MAFLALDQVHKLQEERFIVKPTSFSQDRLERIAIAGETGSGKSTLLKMIGGLTQPDGGIIYFEGNKVAGPLEQLLPGHAKIAYLSQHFELRNNYKMEDLLEMSNLLNTEFAETIFSICQINHLLKRKSDQLSGGEKQRIALAKCLIAAPSLLLLDEPFSNLDRVHKDIIKSVIEDIGTQLHITCILVSHDATDTLSWADRMIMMKDGAIIQQGTPKQLYYHPLTEYTAALMGEYNLIDTNLYPDFISLLGESVKGKKAMLRPEQLLIVKENERTVTGIVEQVLFYGSHYMIHVIASGLTIKIRTSNYLYNPGDIVHIGLSYIG